MKTNIDFKYDLKIGVAKEIELLNIFENKTVEVKFDKIACRTGNVFVEYNSRNKPSGISTTKSDYYCFCFGKTYHLIETKELKLLCRKYINTKRDVLGGDMNTSKGILLPIKELL